MKKMDEYYFQIKDPNGKQVMGFDVLSFAQDLSKEKFPLEINRQEGFVDGFIDAYEMIMASKRHNEKLQARKNQPGGKVVPVTEKQPLAAVE